MAVCKLQNLSYITCATSVCARAIAALDDMCFSCIVFFREIIHRILHAFPFWRILYVAWMYFWRLKIQWTRAVVSISTKSIEAALAAAEF